MTNTPEKFFLPWCLGAPLYMPAHQRDLIDLANGEKFPDLRTLIFCTEDAITHTEVEGSLRHLGLCLQGFRPHPKRFRFIRARNPEILARLLALPEIEKIDGFVLPKFTSEVFNAYFDQLRGSTFKIMPTLETREVFDPGAMRDLRAALLQEQVREHILMLRIGGNDLMQLLGLRRPRGLTIYDTPMGNVIAQLAALFKPYGFSLAAPVFEALADNTTLLKEIQLDLAHGLNGKTAIHPTQVPAIEKLYRVEPEDFEMARKILDGQSPAVFKMHDTMCEVTTHSVWATDILCRHKYFGMHEAMPSAEYIGYSN